MPAVTLVCAQSGCSRADIPDSSCRSGRVGSARSLRMTDFAKTAAGESRLSPPDVTAVGASQGAKYQVGVSIVFNHVSKRNLPKYFTVLTTKLFVRQSVKSFFVLGLKIRVSVVRFAPGQHSNAPGFVGAIHRGTGSTHPGIICVRFLAGLDPQPHR
jgi:hypothetical protein